MAAGVASQSQAAVPTSLVQSTIQIALGLAAGNTAAVLARGVLHTMLLSQIKSVAALVLLGAAGCLIAGYSWAIGPMRADQPPVPSPRRSSPRTFGQRTPSKSLVSHCRCVALLSTNRADRSPEQRCESMLTGIAKPARSLPRTGRSRSRSNARASMAVRSWRIQPTAIGSVSSGMMTSSTSRAQTDTPARIVLKASRDVIVRVTDASKAPVPDASVQAGSVIAIVGDARTDPYGSAQLRIPVDAKIEWVIALKSGAGFDYAEFGPIDAYRRSQGGAPAAELPMSIPLALDGGRTVRVQAVDPDNKPLVGVSFSPWLLHRDGRRSDVNLGSRIFGSTTGSDGVAVFDWLPANKESLTFWPNSEGYAHRRVVLQEFDNGPITATLTRIGSIRGRVVLPDGSPAQGIEVRAIGSGQGSDNGQGHALTAADGSYEMDVNTREGYAVYVDDNDWAAPSRLDVVVRDSNPVGGVDFKLVPGTIIRGRVTVGPGNRPAAKQFIAVDETGGPAPADLRKRETGSAREIGRQFGATTDASGRYSIRVGPGTYTLMGPPRTGNEKLTITAETELIRDFQMPRPPKGTITGRVVLAGARDEGVAWAKVQIAAVNMMSVPFAVTADAQGRFQAERELDPLVVCATSSNGELGAIVEVGAEDPEVTIPIAPTATATGRLLDENGQTAANQELYWGRRVFVDEDQRVSMTCFAPKVVTRADGRFTLPALVVGQEYEISLQRENVYHAAGAVRPETASAIDLGTLRAGAYRPKSPSSAEEMSSFRKDAPAPARLPRPSTQRHSTAAR